MQSSRRNRCVFFPFLWLAGRAGGFNPSQQETRFSALLLFACVPGICMAHLRTLGHIPWLAKSPHPEPSVVPALTHGICARHDLSRCAQTRPLSAKPVYEAAHAEAQAAEFEDDTGKEKVGMGEVAEMVKKLQVSSAPASGAVCVLPA